MRLAVRAKPGAKHESVRWQPDPHAAGGGVLEVAVRARAVEGAANDAVRNAVASALGVRRSAVSIARGQTARVKLLDIDADERAIRAGLTAVEVRTAAAKEEEET